MNAPFVPPVASISDHFAYDRAVKDVACWRGRILDLFALAERSVADTLIVLATAHEGKPIMQRLVGARYDELATALAPSGVCPYPSAHAAVVRFRAHDPMRHALCHGVADIYVNARGEWLAVFRMMAVAAGRHEMVSHVIHGIEAAARLTALEKQGRDLHAVLGQVRARPTG